MRRSLLTLPAGPRLKWVFLIAWLTIAFAVVGGDLPAKFDDAQSNESSSFLPGNAESTKALAASEDAGAFDLRLVDSALMTAEEIGWLDAYHARVRAALSPSLAGEDLAWLEAATRPIGQ